MRFLEAADDQEGGRKSIRRPVAAVDTIKRDVTPALWPSGNEGGYVGRRAVLRVTMAASVSASFSIFFSESYSRTLFSHTKASLTLKRYNRFVG